MSANCLARYSLFDGRLLHFADEAHKVAHRDEVRFELWCDLLRHRSDGGEVASMAWDEDDVLEAMMVEAEADITNHRHQGSRFNAEATGEG